MSLVSAGLDLIILCWQELNWEYKNCASCLRMKKLRIVEQLLKIEN